MFYLAALHELLLSSLVPVGGGGMLGGSNSLSGCCCCLFGCILAGNTLALIRACVGVCNKCFRLMKRVKVISPTIAS